MHRTPKNLPFCMVYHPYRYHPHFCPCTCVVLGQNCAYQLFYITFVLFENNRPFRDELSKPYRSYTAEIINLVEAVQDEEKKEQYKEVFSIALGDTVLLISKSTGIRESHRIVKFYEYPLTKEKNKVELANTRLSFEEVQRTEQELS